MPLLTYLAWLQTLINNSSFISKIKIKTKNTLLVVKTLYFRNAFPKIHFKIAPSKNTYQNCYEKDAVKEKTDRDKRLTMHENIHC